MAHSAHAKSRFAVALTMLCTMLVAVDAHSATHKKSSGKKRAAAAAATVKTADSPGVAGSLVRRSPWLALSDLPNFTEGTWSTKNFTASETRNAPPLKAEFATASTALATTPQLSNAGTTCVTLGMPTAMLRSDSFEFVYKPGRVIMLFAADNSSRRIYTDGRQHPDSVQLSNYGHSVAHWEQNTLVVDTVGLLPNNIIAAGVTANGPVHVTERMHLTTKDSLTIDTTVDAPAVLNKLWTYSITYQRIRDDSTANAQ